jgi:hypothetical protein
VDTQGCVIEFNKGSRIRFAGRRAVTMYTEPGLDQGTQAGQRLHYTQGITKMLLATHNLFAVQLGRSPLHRCEAFLLLARSQRIRSTAKADRHVVITDKALS